MERIAITGMGVVSSLGNDVDEFNRRMLAGEIGMRAASWAAEFEGRKMWWAPVRDFDPRDWIDPKVIEGTDIFAQFALAATQQAVEQSGLDDLDPDRTAVVHGTSIGGAASMMLAQHRLEHGGPNAVDRKMPIQVMPNMAAAQIAIRYGLHGPSMTVTTACASSADAVGLAGRYIERGEADVAICGATEGPIGWVEDPANGGFTPAIFYGYNLYGVESPSDDPQRAMIPFDVERSGIVMGEGSAMLVLEREEHARARGAHVFGFLCGYASIADGAHPSSPDPSGRYEAVVMERALADAGATAADIDAVIAHATGTRIGDLAEIRALNHVFARPELPVCSIKGHLGHSGASSGGMAYIVGLLGMRDGVLVHTAGTREVDPEVRFRRRDRASARARDEHAARQLVRFRQPERIRGPEPPLTATIVSATPARPAARP